MRDALWRWRTKAKPHVPTKPSRAPIPRPPARAEIARAKSKVRIHGGRRRPHPHQHPLLTVEPVGVLSSRWLSCHPLLLISKFSIGMITLLNWIWSECAGVEFVECVAVSPVSDYDESDECCVCDGDDVDSIRYFNRQLREAKEFIRR